jgi:hypothetical protein
MSPIAAERVARGAALLDRECPGWAARIDPDVLDLSHTRLCLLGQLHGTFGEGLARLDLRGEGRPCMHGFAIDRFTWWDELHEAWVAEIARRAQANGDGPPRDPGQGGG